MGRHDDKYPRPATAAMEQPAHAGANAYFVGAINRVSFEDPWQSASSTGRAASATRARFVAEDSRDGTELITAELDLDQIRDVRNVWQFYRDRRPERYAGLVKL
jgi:N-carbamoylputrescine amidase